MLAWGWKPSLREPQPVPTCPQHLLPSHALAAVFSIQPPRGPSKGVWRGFLFLENSAMCLLAGMTTCESCSVVSDSLRLHGLYSPWNSPGQNTGVGSLSLLQGIFPAQGSNWGLLHCRWILYQLSYHDKHAYKPYNCIYMIS